MRSCLAGCGKFAPVGLHWSTLCRRQKQVNRRLVIAALLAAGLVGGHAGAETIYRWVDQDGVVHFGGSPPQGVHATVVNSPGESGGLSAPVADPKPVAEDGEEVISYAEQRRRERAEKRDAAQKADVETQQKCAEMQRRRDALEPSTRVIVTGPDGNPVRMDDDERLAKLKEAKDYLEQNCR